jgi:hypothetical protein
MTACQLAPVVPPGFESLVAPLPAPAVPLGFVPRATSMMPIAPRAAPESPAAPPAATDGSPPREWLSSLIVYTKRPQQPVPSAPMGPALTTLDRQPPTTVPDHLVLVALTSPSTLSPILTSVRVALPDPNWSAAMEDEYGPLMSSNVITGKWVFTHKLHADVSFDCYKARWVLQGFTRRPGVDYDETFNPVVKPATIHTVLAIAVSHDWPIQQLDVKNTFLHGTLSETIF